MPLAAVFANKARGVAKRLGLAQDLKHNLVLPGVNLVLENSAMKHRFA